jgi:hypothetical protein
MLPTAEVWYVRGADPDALIPLLFKDKMSAEIYARQCFPDEDPDTRYARIYFVNVYDLN